MELQVAGRRVLAGTGGRAFDPKLPAAVFLHGAGMDHTVWALQTRSFAHHGRSVLALDLPGHGGSEGPPLGSIAAMAEWVLQALDAVGAGPTRIAGHSMGSLVALEVAARGGERIDGLALLGFVPDMPVHGDLLGAAAAGAHLALDLMVSWSFGAQARLGASLAPGIWLQGEAMRLLEHSPAATLAADLGACNGYKAAAEAAAHIRCRTRLVLGAEDRMTPAAQGSAFANRIAGAEITVLPGVGHMMMVEDPVGTLRALKTVL